MSSPSDFYRDIAGDYDRMTRLNERLSAESQTLARWKQRYGFQTALDAACGTGLHAIALSRLGVKAVASDISSDMLETAKNNARNQDAQISFIEANMTELADRFNGPFDAIFCLGNSLPHLERDAELHAALKGFARLISPRGALVLQLLNYAKILKSQERIVGVSGDGDTQYVRFYDFLDGRVRFNILTIRRAGAKFSHRLASTILRPYTLPDLQPALQKAGFSELEAFGDMGFSDYTEEASANLVLAARR